MATKPRAWTTGRQAFLTVFEGGQALALPCHGHSCEGVDPVWPPAHWRLHRHAGAAAGQPGERRKCAAQISTGTSLAQARGGATTPTFSGPRKVVQAAGRDSHRARPGAVFLIDDRYRRLQCGPAARMVGAGWRTAAPAQPVGCPNTKRPAGRLRGKAPPRWRLENDAQLSW